jgi:Tol biopolymer transport system component
MLNERGQVKVLDFGLAKIAQPAEQNAASSISTMAKTASGVVMGTVPYMSPEQALGREVDHRSDLFSLGVALYEMATGRLPFSGANSSETLDRILHAQPDAMARFNYDVPAELERIVRKCLEKERERRYQSARELLVDLKNLKRDSAATAPTAMKAVSSASRFNQRQRSALIALAVLILLGASLTYFVLRPPLPPKVTASAQITRDGFPKFAREYLRASLVTDGSRLYLSERAREQWILAQVSSTGGETVAIPEPFLTAFLHDISPSRSELLVESGNEASSEQQLWALPVLGGAPRRLGDLLGHDGTWSLDGQKIVYANASTLYLANGDGTKPHEFVTVPDRRLYWPRWSPDGSRLRFSVQDTKTYSVSLWEVAADGSNPHPLLPGWNNPAGECCGNWTADGRYFVFHSTRNGTTNVWAMREQAGLFRRANQEPVQLTVGPLDYYSPLPSKDGKKIFVVGEQRRGELARYDMRTQQWSVYLSGVSAEHLDFTRDGERVTYVTYPEYDLWQSRVDGSERRQLTYPPMQACLPRWSPDGKQIAFSARVPGKPWKAYLISAEGGAPEQLTAEERREIDPGWAPDGKTLVFGDHDAKKIFLLDLNTRRISKLPGSDGLFSPRWSPDGRYILALPRGLMNKLLLFDFTTQKWAELAKREASEPRWSQNGKYAYFSSYSSNDPALFRVRVDDRKLERLVSMKDFRQVNGVWGSFVCWSPDDSPLVLRDVGTQDIYALEWRAP